MTSRARILTSLLILVAGLALTATALASPDGDDDPTYNNTGSTFGTQYSNLARQGFTSNLTNSQPVTDQAPDGASITANLMFGGPILTRGGRSGQYLRLTRFDINGQPGGLGGNGIRELFLDQDLEYTELLDIRVLGDGTFVVLIRATSNDQGDILQALRFSADGTVAGPPQYIELPDACDPPTVRGEGGGRIYGYVSAARVNASGAISSLWDCFEFDEDDDEVPSDRGVNSDERFGVFVAQHDTTGSETDSVEVDGAYGEDLELGPSGDPYALVGSYAEPGRGQPATASLVHRVPLSGGNLDTPEDSPYEVPGPPVDLAVDSQARPLVWTQTIIYLRGTQIDWAIYRLNQGRTALDSTWGNAGKSTIADPRLGYPSSGGDGEDNERAYLTVRPGDKVLATDSYQPQSQQQAPRQTDSFRNGIIAGLTAGGQTDTGFATGGFKVLEYTGQNGFDRIGEPTLQSDGKVLIPHTNEPPSNDFRSGSARITPPPNETGLFVGVTRLRGAPGSTTTTTTPSTPGPVAPSAAPTICGRRAISLVRADVRGNRVKLTGLVGAALYGKTVTIQTDPKGAKSSKFTKTTTVKASSTGAFTAFVKKPARADFVSVRYRAVSGSAKSPVLKLPQRLTSRSVKAAAGKITVKGRVTKSVLGKRNKVLIRRLVCGRYRTVGTAKPDANGNYTVTFNATQIRGVAFYRAESKVLRKRGSKVYVVQYARAIAIRTTSQTG